MPTFFYKFKWLVPILLVAVHGLPAQGQLLTAFNKGKEAVSIKAAKEQKKESLVGILAQLKTQYQLNFHYNSDLLAPLLANPDIMNVPKGRLDERLGELLKPLQLSFIKAGTDAYIITPLPAGVAKEARPAAHRLADVVISGKVTSAKG